MKPLLNIVMESKLFLQEPSLQKVQFFRVADT